MATLDAARKALGQLFIIGFDGLELSDDTASFLSQANIGGFILFAHNYEYPAQVAELINQVQECRQTQERGQDLPLFACVDQEGGKVQRFKKPFTIIPPALTIGQSHSPKHAFEIAEMMSKELKAVGINVNFCPIADINTNPKNPIIGNRAYGDDEDTVSKMVSAMVRGHVVSGVLPCVKHFPGHGDTTVDSHLALPKIDTPLETLKDREFKPFSKGFKARCALLMTAHIVHSELEPKLPATLSKFFLQDILRKELRYSRVIISDDMEMSAITDHFTAEEAPVMALNAGCDMLIYRSEKAARHAYASLEKALEEGRLLPETILQAAARIEEVKKEYLMPYKPASIPDISKVVGIPAHQELIDKLPKG